MNLKLLGQDGAANRREWLKGILAVGAASMLGAAGPRDGRSVTIDDYLRCKEIGLARVSPDGRWLAVEVRRGRVERGERTEDQNGESRSDIWLVSLETGEARALTDGRGDGAGYWSPIWAPRSDAIAVLTNKGLDAVRPAVLDPSSGKIRIYGDRSVDVEVNFGSPSPWQPAGRIWAAWYSDTQLLTALLAPGAMSWGEANGNPMGAYGRLWTRTREGEPSVTVWDSRAPLACGLGTSLVSVDARSDAAPQELASGPIRSVTLSRSRRLAAIVLATRPRPVLPDDPVAPELGYNAYSTDMVVETALAIYEIGGPSLLTPVKGVADLGFHAVRRHPQWGLNDRWLAVPAFSTAGRDKVYRVDVASRAVEVFPARSPLDAELLAAMIARHPKTSGLMSRAQSRIDLSAQQAEQTGSMAIPGSVFSFDGQDLAVVCDRKVMSLDRFGRVVDILDLGQAALIHACPPSQPTLGAIFESPTETFVVESVGRKLRARALSEPVKGAKVVMADERSTVSAWLQRSGGPTRLWICDGHVSQSRVGLEVNAFLDDVTAPTVEPFAYRLPSGTPAMGALLLPRGYVPGRRYPVVIHGYPTTVITAANVERQSAIGVQSYAHRLLLCAQGYVVAVPSMPIPSGSQSIEPLDLVAGQIEKFAESLLEHGVAAPGQIGFLGHSYGGFAALAVAARSKLVSAVVASSPFADLIAFHDLPFKWYEREACAPNRHRFHALEVESTSAVFLRMGGTPSEAFQKYIENSPRFQMGQKAPPLLMLQGEFDADSFRQSDAVFTSLSRHGVPVRVARYWAEGHNLGGPGNIKHAWLEVSGWFQNYIGQTGKAAS